MTASHQENPRGNADDIDLLTLLSLFWRRKGVITSCVTLFAALGTYRLASTYPIYQANTLILLEQRKSAPIIFQTASGFGGEEVTASTEVEIISSRMVLGQAVAQNDLDWRVAASKAPIIGNILARYNLPIPEWDFLLPYARHGERLVLSNLQVPPGWVGRGITVTNTEGGYRLLLPDGSIHDGQAGIDLTLDGLGFSINFAEHPTTAGREFVVTQLSEQQAIRSLQAVRKRSSLMPISGAVRSASSSGCRVSRRDYPKCSLGRCRSRPRPSRQRLPGSSSCRPDAIRPIPRSC